MKVRTILKKRLEKVKIKMKATKKKNKLKYKIKMINMKRVLTKIDIEGTLKSMASTKKKRRTKRKRV